MAEYQLTATETVIRTEDGASIPNDPANRDRAEYDKWLAEGGVPDPYVPPPDVPPVPSQEQQILFDHENRILAQEGLPPMTAADFVTKMRSG
jgi:ABC-type glycerol-3-phosphate transport system substrate-binding protein